MLKQNATEAFGAEASSREQHDWADICPDGGTLLKTLICTAVVGDGGSWQFGRLFVSEFGLLFAAGLVHHEHDPAGGEAPKLLRWRDVEDVEHRALGMVDAEAVVSASRGQAGASTAPRLCLKMAQASVLWLVELWRFCSSVEAFKSSGRLPSEAAQLRPPRKRLSRRATTLSTVSFTLPGIPFSEDEDGKLPRSGSDSCLLALVRQEPGWLPGQVVEFEPEEEESPREEHSNAGLDERGKRLLARWPALQDVCGVRLSTAGGLWENLQLLTDWRRFDMFAIGNLTSQPLALVGCAALAGLGFLDTLDLPTNKVHRVLSTWERGYRRDVAFHTSMHAANVTQAVYYSLAAEGMGRRLSHNVCLSMLFASMVHDVGHPGVNNHFLVSNRDPLAVCFEDRSVLEQLHCSLAFELLEASGVKLFGALGAEAAESVRRRMTKIILSTDMAHHNQGMAEVAALACREDFSWDDPETQSQLSSSLVHCHDVSNPCRPWESFVEWTNLVMEEFFRQADLERQLGLVFSGGLSRGYAPLDREKPFNVPHFQLGFANHVVQPLCLALSSIPGITLQCQKECLEENIERLTEESEQWSTRHPAPEPLEQ